MGENLTETNIAKFYDTIFEDDPVFKPFWDEVRRLRLGFVSEETGDDALMFRKAGIEESSVVLDIGCGGGETAMDLAKYFNCKIIGIDISNNRIKIARENLKHEGKKVRKLVEFKKASVTTLPFDNSTFTHAWSQCVLFYVPTHKEALREIFRVIAPGGTFIFNDLTLEKKITDEQEQKFIFDELKFYSACSKSLYERRLKDVGFKISEELVLNTELKKNAECYAEKLTEMAKEIETAGIRKKYEWLAAYFNNMAKAAENKKLGWALFVCKKM